MLMMIRLIKEETGQGMAEYAMIFVGIVLIAMVGYQVFGLNLQAKLNEITAQI